MSLKGGLKFVYKRYQLTRGLYSYLRRQNREANATTQDRNSKT